MGSINIRDAVMDSLVYLENTNTLDEIVAEQVTELIKETIRESLKSYNPVGSAIQDSIKEAMNSSAASLDLPSYNVYIAQLVNDCFTDTLQKEGKEHLQQLIANTVGNVPVSSTFTSLLEEIQTKMETFAGGEIKEETNEDASAIYLTIPDEYNESIKVSLFNFSTENKNHYRICYISTNRDVITGFTANRVSTYRSELVNRLYAYYAKGTLFEKDHNVQGSLP